MKLKKNATKVFTDNADIKKAYLNKSEVLPIKKKVVRKIIKEKDE